jgi:ferredoxin
VGRLRQNGSPAGPTPVTSFNVSPETKDMKVRFDRDTCIGMFQCTAEWDAFLEDNEAGKADLADAEETAEDIFERAVPEDAELDAKFAARACPVDAIEIYDDDGEQIV